MYISIHGWQNRRAFALALLCGLSARADAIDLLIPPLAGTTRLHEVILVANNWAVPPTFSTPKVRRIVRSEP